MSFLKKHWQISVPAAGVLLCLFAIGTYAVIINTEPPETRVTYALPESRVYTEPVTTLPQPVEQHNTPALTPDVAAAPQPRVKHIDVDPDTRDEMLAKYEAVQAELAAKQLYIKSLELKIARAEERQALIAKADAIDNLHTWATTHVASTWTEIEPDLDRGDELGMMADIEAQEIWDEFIARVARFDSSLQQQVIDTMRTQYNEEVADLMVDDLARYQEVYND